jgi:acyl-coenzyme A thioesterase PaaI-like protein
MTTAGEAPSAHPALVGREQPMAELSDVVRHLVELVVTNAAPVDVLRIVTAQLRDAADTLAAHRPDDPHPRFVSADRPGDDRSMIVSMPYDPVIGRYNPLALPVEITFEPPVAVGTARFTTPYEGGPGWVHGAAIAATFDIVLTAANHLAGAAGPTVWLTIRFRRPTLVGVEARFEAEVVETDGRRVTSRGRLVQDGKVCVEAEGEFAVLDVDRINRAARRASPGAEGKDPTSGAQGRGPTGSDRAGT